MIKTWLIAATALAATGIAHPGPAQAFKRLEVGQPVGDHTLATPGGGARQLADTLGPRATVIVFWATWSPRSSEALGDLQALRAMYGGRGLALVTVNVDGPGHDTAPAAGGAGLGPAVVQLIDADLSLYDAWGVVAVPSLVLLDGGGRVAALSSGYSRSARETFAGHTRKVLGVAEPEPEATARAEGYRPAGAAGAHYRMAQLLLRKHQTDRALQLLGQALAEDPRFEEARAALAAVLRRAGRPDEALRLELAAVESEEYCLVPRRSQAPARWQ
jgi:thioredoxin-like negative regulator of GroEL